MNELNFPLQIFVDEMTAAMMQSLDGAWNSAFLFAFNGKITQGCYIFVDR